MGDDGMADFDIDDVLDWIYVEDDFPLADELAESQIPDPGYAGTQYEIDMEELDDFDVFDYWDDLQYGDDSYWEYARQRKEASLKRKRDVKTTTTNHEKRQRLNLIDTHGENVRFVNRLTRNEMATRKAPSAPKRPSFALFPDWRKRFANTDGAPLKKEMPAAMKHAAEGTFEDTPAEITISNGAFVDTNGVHVDHEAEEDDSDDMQADLASLDPETLKAILRQKLGDAGLDGMDENTLMAMLGKMLSGEDGADDAVDDLTNDLVERATEGKDAALSDWLSQQGVSFDAVANGEDDTDSIATPEMPDVVNGLKDADKVKSSPSDSAIDMQKGVASSSTEMAIHPSSPSELLKKRSAPFADAEAKEVRKRKRVSFDVAAASEAIAVAEHGSEIQVPEQNGEESAPLHDEVPSLSEQNTGDAAEDDSTIVVQTRATNAAAVKKKHGHNDSAETNDSRATRGKEKPEPKAASTVESDQPDDEIIVTTPAPAKNTRKRKAEAEKPAPKKQAKKTSAPAEAVGKRTRSTRTATKARR